MLIAITIAPARPFRHRYHPRSRYGLTVLGVLRSRTSAHSETGLSRMPERGWSIEDGSVPTRPSFARSRSRRPEPDRPEPRAQLRLLPSGRAERERVSAEPISEEAYWALSQEPRVDIEQLRRRWQTAFDAALAALRHAALYLPANELRDRGGRLAVERDLTTELLQALARDEHDSSEISPLGVSRWEARELLGLPAGVDACVFNLDGVLIGSAAIHAAAWTETFDEFISRRIDRTGGRFAPFNQRIDYPQHMHGKPRLDGVRAFLAS